MYDTNKTPFMMIVMAQSHPILGKIANAKNMTSKGGMTCKCRSETTQKLTAQNQFQT